MYSIVITLYCTFTSSIGVHFNAYHIHNIIHIYVCLLFPTGLSLRGHGDGSDSNFLQLLKLRQEDDKRIKTWMDKKANNYTAPDMQNEILREMALQVLRQVIASVQAAQFFTIMVDETTDVSNNEQVVICFQWVDGELEAHEEFVGLYETNSTHAQVLHSLIHDVLLRTNLSITRLRGQCYDGASSMLGARGGVAKLILDEEPRALHTHCYGHALNLACSDAVKGCKVMRDVLDTSYAIVKLIKKSPRRDAMLKNLRQQLPETTPGIRVLCPTRWTVRAKSLQSIIDNFNVLQELWDESLDVVKETEMRATIIGVSSCMKTFNFFFGLVLGDLVLRHSDNLSKTLQSLQISAAEGQKVADMTVTTLQSIRSDANFDLFWSKVTRMATHCEVEDPVLPRRRKRPRRYEHGSAEGDFASDVKSFYRSIYFEALDLVTSAIKARFDQPGYKVYCKLEDLLVKGANDEKFGEELTFITDFYKDDFDSAQLEMQLKVMSSNLTQVPPNDLHSLLKYLRSISTSQRVLMSQVCKLASLILVMPATNASCERSFSSLRRVKTYLRATMTQSRLNNIMMLHIHKECTDQLNLIDLGNAFVRNSHHRETLFGKFLPNDLEVDI